MPDDARRRRYYAVMPLRCLRHDELRFDFSAPYTLRLPPLAAMPRHAAMLAAIRATFTRHISALLLIAALLFTGCCRHVLRTCFRCLCRAVFATPDGGAAMPRRAAALLPAAHASHAFPAAFFFFFLPSQCRRHAYARCYAATPSPLMPNKQHQNTNTPTLCYATPPAFDERHIDAAIALYQAMLNIITVYLFAARTACR